MTFARVRRAIAGRLSWFFACAVAVPLGIANWAPVQRLDLAAYDALEPLFRTDAAPPTSTVIAIDERSISVLGQWPWNREVFSEVIDRLSDAGVAAIGMPILFAEASPGDAVLAEAMRRSGRVVLAVAPREPDPTSPDVFEILPTAVLTDAAAALGHVDVEVDADALARRIYRRAGSGGPTWEALAVATLNIAHSERGERQQRSGDDLHVAPVAVRGWYRQDELLLPHPGQSNALPTLSYLDLHQQPARAQTLAGQTVFIGVTATGLDSGLTTPAARSRQPMAAVEFHVRAFEALRNDQVYQSATPLLTVGLSLLFLMLPTLLVPSLGLAGSVALGGLILVPLLASGVSLGLLQLWIPPTTAIVAFLVGYVGGLGVWLRRTLGALRHTQRHAAVTLCSIADAVITVDSENRVVFMNPVAERLSGLRLEESKGRALEETLGKLTQETVSIGGALADCLQTREPQRLADPIHWLSPQGQAHALQLTVAPIGKGKDGAVLAFHDLTDTVAISAQLRHEATHDAMTGLPNRSLLLERLERALLNTHRSGEMIAILFIDLDRFKRINDSLGHHAGDTVLKSIAQRLVSSTREGDTVSRWGGDEFIILMESLKDRLVAVAIAEKILNIVEEELHIESQPDLVVSCSIGVAIGPHDGSDAQTLLSIADKAMYEAKLEGGSCYNFHTADMNHWSRDRLELEAALRQALVQRQFELYYQPQIDINNGQLAGLEALIRWHRPEIGLVNPDSFIPTAEESGIILSIGDWVIREAVDQLSRWLAEGMNLVPIAINLSSRQCVDTNVASTLENALAEHNIDAALIKLEITESIAMNTTRRTTDLIHKINQLGIDMELDDFGTGYSSLSLLRRFRIPQLKIDRSFVDSIAINSDDAAIVRGTIALAHGLGMTVVAEGVETEAQLHFLAEHKCDKVQGFLFSPPKPANEIRPWLIALPPHALQSIGSVRQLCDEAPVSSRKSGTGA